MGLLATRLAAGAALAALVAGCGEVPVYEGPAFARDPPAVAPLTGRILISNGGDDTISAVDPALGLTDGAPAAVTRVPVGLDPVDLESPGRVSADRAGRFIYVSLTFSVAASGPHAAHGSSAIPGLVLKLETGGGREVGRIGADPNPAGHALSADGTTLFVTHYDLRRWRGEVAGPEPGRRDSNLMVIDTERMLVKARLPLCPAAQGVALAPDESVLYATCGPDEIAVVDLRHPSLPVRRVPLEPGSTPSLGSCSRCPQGLSVAPDGTLWVTAVGPSGGVAGRGSLHVFDPAYPAGGAFDQRRMTALAGSPRSVTFAGGPSSYRVFVPERGSRAGHGHDPGSPDRLRVFETSSPGAPVREVADQIFFRAICASPSLMVLGETMAQLLCEGEQVGPGSLLWIDVERRLVLASARVGVSPAGLAVVPRSP